MRHSVTIAALSALSLVAAQTNTIQNFTINPSEVGLSTRAGWCQGEINTCNTLCDSNPLNNMCDPNTLDYSCLCQNNSAPGLQYYTETMYTFTCQQAFSDCITANQNDARGQANCTTNIEDKCGTLNPANASVGAASSSGGSATTTPTATGGTVSPASGPSSTSSTTKPSASAPPTSSSSKGAGPTHAAQLGNGVAAIAAAGLLAALL